MQPQFEPPGRPIPFEAPQVALRHLPGNDRLWQQKGPPLFYLIPGKIFTLTSSNYGLPEALQLASVLTSNRPRKLFMSAKTG